MTSDEQQSHQQIADQPNTEEATPAIPVHAETTTPDAKAPPVEMNWDKETVPLEAIERAFYALADQVTATTEDAGTHWRTMIHARGPRLDEVAMSHRIRQEVNDQTLRVKISERTAPVRNLVFAVAFSRSGIAASEPEPAASPSEVSEAGS